MYSDIIKQRFNTVWDDIKRAGLEGQIFPEEAKLRMQLEIENGKGQYIFDLKKESLADNIKNFVLQRNDVFVPSAFGVMIGITETATGVQKLYPYAPKTPSGVPSVYAAGFESDTIENLYAGHLTWKLGTNVMLNQFPMENFKKVPQGQGAFVLDSNDDAVSEQIQPEWSIEDCLHVLMPRYTIAGQRDHYITVNFDAATLSFPVTSGYTAELVLYIDGFLIKGGCEKIAGKNAFGDAPGNW